MENISSVYTIRLNGIDAVPVRCESALLSTVDLHLTGLADAAVKETLLRTVTALQSLGYHLPGRGIIINLVPADLTKSGTGYDLSIALCIIASSRKDALPELDHWLVLGELGLDGSLRPVPGMLQAVLEAKRLGCKGCIIPSGEEELIAPFSDGIDVFCLHSLSEAIDTINGQGRIAPLQSAPVSAPSPATLSAYESLFGNEGAKRAVEIAAAGGHNLFLFGAPGSGKTFIAKALAELLPEMTAAQQLECARIYSASRRGASYRFMRPFRAPHKSASKAALLGGGGENVMPGEVSLATNGVLYLDEFCETPKSTLEALRAPLEDHSVCICRLKSKVSYPARFVLVAASNPCPCGYYGEGDRCTCTPAQRRAYLSRIAGPVYDRLTVQAYVHPFRSPFGAPVHGESLSDARERVRLARERQATRYAGKPYETNEDVPAGDLERFCRLDKNGIDLLETIFIRLGYSSRAYSRVLRIARTIADLEGSEDILLEHIAEATSYRFLDRSFSSGETELFLDTMTTGTMAATDHA